MNTETIIVAIVGVITSALSSWFSWVLSKKKYNSEVKSSELDNLKKCRDVRLTDVHRVKK